MTGLLRALRLDIFALNYSLSAESFKKYMFAVEENRERAERPGSRLPGYLSNFLGHVRRGGHAMPRPTVPQDHRWVLFLGFSTNQGNALAPLQKALGADMLGTAPVSTIRYPVGRAYLLSLPFIPILLWHLVTADGYRRTSLRMGLTNYLLTFGYYLTTRRYLARHRPRVLVLSNDTTMFTRTAMHAAREFGIRTVYVQHAAVSDEFPALAFDVALLDGRDALHKYSAAGPSQTEAYLVGIQKADAFFDRINRGTGVASVGICINEIDPLERLEELMEAIRRHHPTLTVSVRPHPADTPERLAQVRDMAEAQGCRHSDPRQETSFQFLCSMDCIITGQSSIMLEAALLNVYPLFYDYAQNAMDMYKFLHNGLVDERITRPERVVELLDGLTRERPSIRHRAKYYCATIGTTFDGRSTQLATSILDAQRNGGASTDVWTRVTMDGGMQVFELRQASPTRAGDTGSSRS